MKCSFYRIIVKDFERFRDVVFGFKSFLDLNWYFILFWKFIRDLDYVGLNGKVKVG